MVKRKRAAKDNADQPIQFLQRELLWPAPWNPRKRFDGRRLSEMARSIKEVGMLQPILVRPIRASPNYEIVCGHRRVLAAEIAGLDVVPAIVRELSDDAAFEATVTENLERQDLLPIEEARGVAGLLSRPGWTVEAVADKLGKPAGWVARRARVAQLSERWQAIVDGAKSPIAEWPATWLEEVALMAPASQNSLLTEYRHQLENAPNLRSVRGWVRNHLQALRDANWDLGDADLLPEAGSCTACPHRSSQQELLFAADNDWKDDRCLDRSCWEKKKAALVAARERKLSMERGAGNYVKLTYNDSNAKNDSGLTPVWMAREVPEGTAGAIPAVHVDGVDAGKQTWVAPPPSGKTSAAPKKKLTKAEQAALIDEKRKEAALDELCDRIERSVLRPSHLELCRLALAFCIDPDCFRSYDPFVRWEGVKEETDLDALLWAGVRPEVDDLIVSRMYAMEDRWEFASEIAAMLSIDLPSIYAAKREEIPDPTEKRAKKKVAKKGAKKEKASR